MFALRLASVLVLLVLLMGCGVAVSGESNKEEAASPVLLRVPHSPLALGALLTGELVVDGRCLYVVDEAFGNEWLPVFAAQSVLWENGALVVDGETFEIGDKVSMGGGERKNIDNREFIQEPNPSCDVQNVWIAWTVSEPMS